MHEDTNKTNDTFLCPECGGNEAMFVRGVHTEKGIEQSNDENKKDTLPGKFLGYPHWKCCSCELRLTSGQYEQKYSEQLDSIKRGRLVLPADIISKRPSNPKAQFVSDVKCPKCGGEMSTIMYGLTQFCPIIREEYTEYFFWSEFLTASKISISVGLHPVPSSDSALVIDRRVCSGDLFY